MCPSRDIAQSPPRIMYIVPRPYLPRRQPCLRKLGLGTRLRIPRLFRSGNLVFSSRNWDRDRDWPLEDMFVFTTFLFQDFNKRQVTKPGHRTDTRQVCFSLKSMLNALLAAKCVSLSLCKQSLHSTPLPVFQLVCYISKESQVSTEHYPMCLILLPFP